jgi:glycosyltransferase involved in cell wall biosynthesis
MTGERLSVVTPTLDRPAEVEGLLDALAAQTRLPMEVILVDGAPAQDRRTELVVAAAAPRLPYACGYLRADGGTAVQRNAGVASAAGEYVAFLDDDIRPEPDFFARILEVFAADPEGTVGGVTGMVANEYLDPTRSPRWRWYRRLRLFTTYEPGRYDFGSGYPINRYLQPPHEGVRAVDFFGTSCAVWRREVLDAGLRFDPFFSDYGTLEDAHFALRAGRRWRLLECGRARCRHLRAPGGRPDRRRLAWKSAVNYRYVFIDIVPKRSVAQEARFWRFQLVDLGRYVAHAMRVRGRDDWVAVLGKAQGIAAAARLRAPAPEAERPPNELSPHSMAGV